MSDHFQVPDREPNEAPATAKQLEYLRHLADFEESDLEKLGKWQASALIDHLQDARGIQRSHRYHKPKKRGCGYLVIILVIVSIWALRQCGGNESEPEPVAPLPVTPAPEPVAPKPAPVTPEREQVEPEPKIPEVTSEPTPPPVVTLETVELPVTITLTAPASLLDAAGKETEFSAGTAILVNSRTKAGTLTTRVDGKLYVGSESRIKEKYKINE